MRHCVAPLGTLPTAEGLKEKEGLRRAHLRALAAALRSNQEARAQVGSARGRGPASPPACALRLPAPHLPLAASGWLFVRTRAAVTARGPCASYRQPSP